MREFGSNKIRHKNINKAYQDPTFEADKLYLGPKAQCQGVVWVSL